MGKWAIVLAPFGHGKSSLISVGLPLYELACDTALRIALISNVDENSKLRLRAITRYVESDRDFHRIAPHVRPAARENWTKQKIFVERKSSAPEPSIVGAGVLSSMVGRIDLLIADDIVDRKNAIMNPKMRDSVHDNFREAWMSRLSPDGRVAYICSVWHRQDATHRIIQDPKLRGRIRALIQRVNDGLDGIETYLVE